MTRDIATFRMFIGGRWREAGDGQWIESSDPYSGEVWSRVPRATAGDVADAVAAAHQAFAGGPWREMSATARGALLRRLADLVAARAEELADIESRDNGKLIAEVRAQLRYLPQWFHYFAGLADKLEGRLVPIDRPDLLAYTRYEPLGVVAAITPWNSPLVLAGWKLAPALAAGNTIVVKPSEYTSASTLRFMELVLEAGFPDGVVNAVTGYGAEAGAALIADPRVRKIAFTGGSAGGRAVALQAAADCKRVTLELGGKSPNIVFADADIDEAAAGAISGIFAASGQTCVAGSRLLVERPVHDRLVERVVEMARSAVVGDPRDPSTQIGPITTPAQYEHVCRMIELAEADGAQRLCGGSVRCEGRGAGGLFVSPTVFVGVDNGMRIAREEVFGPVLAVIPFDGEDEAVAIANDSDFGLAAGVWTRDIGRAIRMERRLQAGTVWVNTYRMASYQLPFGGFKRSGIGRENGIDAMKEYTNIKSVMVNAGPAVANPFIVR